MRVTAEVNSPVLGGSIAHPAATPPGHLELTALLFEAAKRCGLQEKELAIALGYDPGYLSRIKAGEKTLPAERLARLPQAVRRLLWTMVAERDGLVVSPDDARRRAIGKLLVALGEAMAVLDDHRIPKRMARCA